MYHEAAVSCIRYLNYNSIAEFDKLTIPEYEILMEGVQLRQVDMDYRAHQQAFLNFAVKGEKKTGKTKTRPVYDKFEKFYDYKKEIGKVKGKKKEDPLASLKAHMRETNKNE